MDRHFDIVHRLGGSERCYTERACPNVFLLSSGEYAVVGRDITDELIARLPIDAGCADDERIVLVPYEVLLRAAPEIIAA
jgi:hypothetical protein